MVEVQNPPLLYQTKVQAPAASTPITVAPILAASIAGSTSTFPLPTAIASLAPAGDHHNLQFRTVLPCWLDRWRQCWWLRPHAP